MPLFPSENFGSDDFERVTLISGAYFDAIPYHKLRPSEKLLIKAHEDHEYTRSWRQAYIVRRDVESRYQARQHEIYKNRKYTVTINHDMVKIKAYGILGGMNGGGGLRGAITGFSNASRKRMLEFMASIRWDMSKNTVFATLTYPGKYASVPVGNVDQWKADFEALRRRIERLSDEIMLVWRKQMQSRKSGETQGITLPHYHAIIFIPENLDLSRLKMPDGTKIVDHESLKLNPDTNRKHSTVSMMIEAWLLAHWHDIVGRGDDNHARHGAHVAPVTSRRHVYYYVSKYVGKTESDDLEVGRRWGRIGGFDTSPLMITDMTPDEYIEFKRLVARWMRARGGKYWRKFVRMPIEVGCTVFGLGDSSNSAWEGRLESTIFDMLLHASGIVLQAWDEKSI